MDAALDGVNNHRLALGFGCFACGIILVARVTRAECIAIVAAVAIAIACITHVRVQKLLTAMLGVVVVGALAGVLALTRAQKVPFAGLDGHHIVVEAVALERPRIQETALMRARIVVVRAPISEAARGLPGAVALVSFPADTPSSLAGQRVIIRGRLDLPGGSRNDGEPAQRDELADQGVSLILVAHHAGDVRAVGAAAGWEAWWARARALLAGAIESRLPALEATVLEGILWGDRGNLPAALRQEFSDTGTVHVLTTAGLHLGIMAAMLTQLATFLPIARPVRAVLVVAGSWLYAALAGMHLPTVRAATMLTAGTVAVELGRARTASAVLSAAALAVVVPHPLVLLSPSFSMSFACVAGIALISPILSALGLREGCGLPRIMVELLRTSCAVQVALWPLQALYFNAFTPYAIITNMIVVPLVGVVMAAGSLLAISTLVVPLLAGAVSHIAWWGLTFIIATVQQFATLPYAHLDMPPPSHVFLVMYWAMLGLLFIALQRNVATRKVLMVSLCAGTLLVFVYCLPGIAEARSRDMRVDVLDVGQADCIVIRAPGGHAMLVDGGGRLERTTSGAVVAAPLGDRVATRTVMPFLLRHWVMHLDAVVLTHPHGDHAGGLPVILSRERVGVLYDSAQLYAGPAYHRALDVVQARHIRWVRAQRGTAFDLGPDVHVKTLAPEEPLITGTSSDINNNSVVLRVTFGDIAMLLTGDAQSEAEQRLLSHGDDDLRADILKVGHHGSAYSSTTAFLAAVHPKIAIISCGLHNVFGHPSPRTLTALQSVDARTYRTDLDGGVSITSDGVRVQAESTLGQ